MLPPNRCNPRSRAGSLLQAIVLSLVTLLSAPTLSYGQESESAEEGGEAQQAQRIAVLTEEERQQQAQQLYAAGEQAFFEQEYEQAVQMWRRAFELCGHPGLVYNMGTAEMHQGHRREAIRLYREFLVMAPDTEARESVEGRIGELQTELDRPPIIVEPGLFEGRFWTWIALGVAGAAGGTAAGFWASANSRRDELASTCGQTGTGCNGAQFDEVTGRVGVTNMALSFSIAALATAVAFYFLERPEPEVIDPNDAPPELLERLSEETNDTGESPDDVQPEPPTPSEESS